MFLKCLASCFCSIHTCKVIATPIFFFHLIPHICGPHSDAAHNHLCGTVPVKNVSCEMLVNLERPYEEGINDIRGGRQRVQRLKNPYVSFFL